MQHSSVATQWLLLQVVLLSIANLPHLVRFTMLVQFAPVLHYHLGRLLQGFNSYPIFLLSPLQRLQHCAIVQELFQALHMLVFVKCPSTVFSPFVSYCCSGNKLKIKSYYIQLG